MHQILANLWKDLNNEQIALTMLSLWHIWKSRCEKVYTGTSLTPADMLQGSLCLAHNILHTHLLHFPGELVKQQRNSHQVHTGPFSCWVDGSFTEPNAGGTGYLLTCNRCLVEYGVGHRYIFSSFQKEALSLLHGMLAVTSRGLQQCLLYRFRAVSSHSQLITTPSLCKLEGTLRINATQASHVT